MDQGKVTRRQNRRKPSEDTICRSASSGAPLFRALVLTNTGGARKVDSRTDKEGHRESGGGNAVILDEGDARFAGGCHGIRSGMPGRHANREGRAGATPVRPFIAALLRRVFHPAWQTLAVLKDDNAPKAVRDLAVWVAVIEVCQKTELLPTRNVATDTPSACSIVAEVLRELGIDKGEALVEKIWRKLNKRDLRQKLDEALPLPPRRKN